MQKNQEALKNSSVTPTKQKIGDYIIGDFKSYEYKIKLK